MSPWTIVRLFFSLFSNTPWGEKTWKKGQSYIDPVVRKQMLTFLGRLLNIRALGCLSLLILGVGLVIWIFRGTELIHGLAIWFISHPISFLMDIVGLAFFLWRWRAHPYLFTQWHYKNAANWAVLGLFFLLDIAVFPFFEAAQGKTLLVNDQKIVQMTNLPDTHQVRWLPYEAARFYGSNSQNRPTHRLGTFHAFDKAGEISWVAPQQPSGLFNVFAGNSDGFKVIHPDGSITQYTGLMTYGEGMCCFDNIRWQLYFKHYLVTIEEIYYQALESPNGERPKVIAIAPYIDYYLHFPLVLPRWGGVFIIHEDGRIEDLSPEEAQNDPRFFGERLYPHTLAETISDAWAWRLGPINFYTLKKDVTEIPTLEGGTSQFPFLVPTEEGAYFFTALSPAGTGQGILKMLFFDAHSGVINLYEVPEDADLIGPNAAKSTLRKAYNGINWSQPGVIGNFQVIEPRPVFKDEVFYWMLGVTTRDFAGVTFSALVNSDTRDRRILAFKTPAEIEAFLTRGVIPNQEAVNIADMSTEDLNKLLKIYLDEMTRRAEN